MTPASRYPHPVGASVAFVDCYGANRREGEVISAPGPYTVRVRVASGTRPAKWQAWDDFGAPEYSRCRGLMTKIDDTDGDREVAG